MSDPLPLADKPASSSSASSRAPLLLPSFLESLPQGSSHTLSSLLDASQQAEDDAREVLPGNIDVCSFDQGYVRQAVFACKTCPTEGQRGGFCFACSVSCHGDHELIELFPKRGFRCDCPTSTIPSRPCSLLPPGSSSAKLPPNADNQYGHNFDARFCICDADYDPQEEAEDMMQCVVCEDWFHSSHLNLTPIPSSKPATTTPAGPEIPTATEDEPSEPVLTEDDYSHIICERCVLAHPVLIDHLGSPGFMTLVKPPTSADSTSSTVTKVSWQVLGRLDRSQEPDQQVDGASALPTGEEAPADTKKHTLPSEDTTDQDQPPSKKVKLADAGETSSICTLAPHPPQLAFLVASRQAAVAPDHGFGTGRVDHFLPDDFREKWCRCDKHLPQLEALPYLLVEEETWEPAEDEGPAPDMDALLLSSLSSLPREQTIDIITGFQDLSAGLNRYLTQVAATSTEEGGKVIGKRDVEEFFEKWKKGERF